jgi:hypothetical protein
MAVVTQIQVRRGTASSWTSANPTLSAGEWGYETDTGKVKIGDGTTAWTSLAYIGAGDVTLTGVQTLTNKTLTAPIITIATNAQAASYTLVLSDQSDLVEISNASANTLTVPLNSSVAFPVGTTITVLQTGAGQTTITPTGGVTINGTPGLKLRAQWSSATLIKRATDTWVAIGDLSA